MDVRLSDEQQALRQAAARLVERAGPKAVPDLDDRARAARLHESVTGAGWRQLRDGDAGGGPVAGAVEVAIVAEELAYGAADTAFLGPVLAAELRRLAGREPADGPRLETVALSGDLSKLASAGQPGATAFDAAEAATALVAERAGDRWEIASLPVATGDCGPDLTRPAAGISPAGGTPTGIGHVDDVGLLRWTAFGTAVTSADLLGSMRAALDMSVAYARQRHQFGAPIGSFQAVQHMLADVAAGIEGSRSAVLHAAWSVDARPPEEALAAAAAAKAYCARAARAAGETAIQVHGGYGNTWECMAHVHLRRALVSTAVLGGIGTNLRRVLGARGLLRLA